MTDAELDRAIAWARANLASATGPAMAASVSYSTWYFAMRFEQREGRSPTKWLSRLRYAEAARLLVTTDLPVEVISHTVGFASSHSFGTNFKKRYGKPPREYRRAARRAALAA